jgi:hypothetical protein
MVGGFATSIPIPLVFLSFICKFNSSKPLGAVVHQFLHLLGLVVCNGSIIGMEKLRGCCQLFKLACFNVTNEDDRQVNVTPSHSLSVIKRLTAEACLLGHQRVAIPGLFEEGLDCSRSNSMLCQDCKCPSSVQRAACLVLESQK